MSRSNLPKLIASISAVALLVAVVTQTHAHDETATSSSNYGAMLQDARGAMRALPVTVVPGSVLPVAAAMHKSRARSFVAGGGADMMRAGHRRTQVGKEAPLSMSVGELEAEGSGSPPAAVEQSASDPASSLTRMIVRSTTMILTALHLPKFQQQVEALVAATAGGYVVSSTLAHDQYLSMSLRGEI